jgi:hypothetical protein
MIRCAVPVALVHIFIFSSSAHAGFCEDEALQDYYYARGVPETVAEMRACTDWAIKECWVPLLEQTKAELKLCNDTYLVCSAVFTDLVKAKEGLAQCNLDYSACSSSYEQCNADYQACDLTSSGCDAEHMSCKSDLSECASKLSLGTDCESLQVPLIERMAERDRLIKRLKRACGRKCRRTLSAR